MKALEKDRNRRYESASGLAADVERHLRHEPVQACPPSNWYRFRKLARRNRPACIAAAAAVLVVLLGTSALAVSNYLIRQEQARTRDEQRRTEEARRLAERRADEIRQGLTRLTQANALLDRGRWYAVERCWDDAHDAFSQAIELHPDHVSVWVERGDLHTRLGLWNLAAADYAREMELREPDTTLRWYQHALLRRAIGDEEGCRQASLAMREHFAGTTRERFIEETLRSSVLVPDPAADLCPLIELAREVVPNNLWSLPYVLGTAHLRAGQADEAVHRLQEWAAQPQWPIGRLSYPVLAMAHYRLGHETEARQALDEAARLLDWMTQERYERALTHPAADAVWPSTWWDYLECQLYYREARLLMDGTAPPDDPRLHVLRARALAGLGWVEQAASEFDAALKLAPSDPQIRQEAHRNRGRCCVDRRQWREAAAEFTAATELRPEDDYLWRSRAVAHFAAGDVDAYRQTCLSMLERFARTENRGTAAGLLMVAVLRDDGIPDWEGLLPLTRVSDPLGHWGAVLRGAALYRAGWYEECVQCLETTATKYRPRPWDLCFLAMARHRLGQAGEARRCLTEATRWIDAANHHTEDDPTGTQPVWGGWHETAVCPLLLREAEELLKSQESALVGQASRWSSKWQD
jgi:tetratricopeptide (TPR) repeat protein